MVSHMMYSAENSFNNFERTNRDIGSVKIQERVKATNNVDSTPKVSRGEIKNSFNFRDVKLDNHGHNLFEFVSKEIPKRNVASLDNNVDSSPFEVFRIDPMPGNAALHMLYDIQEEAAKLIAHRLHDESAQMLAAVYLELAEISRDCSESTVNKIDKVVKHLDEVCEQLRRLSHELRPLILDQLGLMPALQFLATGVRQRSGMSVVISGFIDKTVSKSIETVLYRVVQEALSNVVRHAGATHVKVKLWTTDRKIKCTFSDNGIGLRVPKDNSGAFHGLGLIGIHERLAMLNGNCNIISSRGNGMELQIEIPI